MFRLTGPKAGIVQEAVRPQTASQPAVSGEVQEDVWVPSVCSVCYNQCGVRVRRQNGVVTKIEGNPDSPSGKGRICAKGLSAIMALYDPHRLKRPVKRTNPEKGIGIDPKWQEISWDEALDIVTEKLRKIQAEDPRKLITASGVGAQAGGLLANYFGVAFGSQGGYVSNGHQCGNAEHTMAWSLNAAASTQPDLRYCNYLMVFGCGVGVHAYYSFTTQAQHMAEARARGMKVIAFDPMLQGLAEKADEWVPLRPGTDGAVAMAMQHVLLNELGIYDREALQQHTNAPYLIKPDGRYLRDPQSGKPLVWDATASAAKTYADPTVGEYALEGEYTVQGMQVKPGFQLLRERVATMPPEKAEIISSVPATTIRRIAKEYGEAARIGSTVTIDGKTMPYRPVAVTYFKGAHGHNRTFPASMALSLLSEIVGAGNVPGGVIGSGGRCDGYPGSGLPQWGPVEAADGLMHVQSAPGSSSMGLFHFNNHPTEPREPETVTLSELFTTAFTSFAALIANPQSERFQLPCKAEALINTGGNHLMSAGDPRATEQFLKELFVIDCKLWLDESSELADVVLPDAHYLERTALFTQWLNHTHSPGLSEWAGLIRQQVVPPRYDQRDVAAVMIELADRLGMRPAYNTVVNMANALKPGLALEPDKKYTTDEMHDRILKNIFGDQHGIEWFKENGVIRWPKKVEEVYWGPFSHLRVPIYFEWILDVGDKVRSILDKLGIDEINTEDYDPLPNWHACKALEKKGPEFPLQAIYYRVAWGTFGWTFENPWVNEVSQRDPITHAATVNPATARRMGLKEGDLVWIESANTGGRVAGRLHLMEGMHPEVLGIANNGGHWSEHRPVAKGKGVFFERLIPLNWEYTDPVSLSIDCDAAVKVYKVRKGEDLGIGWQ